MTTALIMGVVVLSLYWTFAVPMNVEASPLGAAAALLVGLFCLGRTAPRSPEETPRPSPAVAAMAVVALIVAAVGFPMPYKAGPILALAGVAGWLAFGARGACFRGVWQALALGGFVLIAQSAVLPIYLRVASGEHNMPWLRRALFGLLWLFGCRSMAVGDSNVFVQMMRDLHGFPVGTERLALFTLSTILLGYLIAIAASPAMRRSALRLIPLGVLVALVYALVRYAVMAVVYLYLMHRMEYFDTANRVDVFWKPWWTAITFLPLALCLAALAPKDEGRDWLGSLLNAEPSDAGRLRVAILSALLAATAIIAAMALPEPASRSAGRILVDEFHSQWERTDRPFDTTWYGTEASYNYAGIYDYLSKHYQMGRLEEPITSASLRGCDVLFVKIPTRNYDASETRTIVEFVRRGGGLFLIGDHTNVFGSGVYLNTIVRPFGFEYRFDSLFDTRKTFEEVYYPPQMLPHPVVQNFPYFFFEVSCSIKPQSYFRGEPVIVGTRLKALSVDYHSPNFYPQPIDRSDMDFGPFVQMWARHFGKGHVLAFTDSTVFSNFCTFQPAKPELLLGSMEWLNRRSHWGRWREVWAALGIVALLVAAVTAARSERPVRTASLSVFVVMGAVPLLACCARWVNREVSGLPLPHEKVTRVYFEQKHCDYELPLKGFVGSAARGYDVFYQWVMRLGAFPFVGDTVDECAKAGDAIVLIRPKEEFTQVEIERLMAFVEGGGGLLVLDGANQPGVAVQPLLNAFRMSIVRTGQPFVGEARADDRTTFTVESAWPVTGGEPLAWSAGGEVLAAISRHGKGRVVVASFGERFCDQSMGGGWGVKPDADLLHVYEMEYRLLRAMLYGESGTTGTAGTTGTTGTTATTATQPTTTTTATQAATATQPTTATRATAATTTTTVTQPTTATKTAERP